MLKKAHVGQALNLVLSFMNLQSHLVPQYIGLKFLLVLRVYRAIACNFTQGVDWDMAILTF